MTDLPDLLQHISTLFRITLRCAIHHGPSAHLGSVSCCLNEVGCMLRAIRLGAVLKLREEFQIPTKLYHVEAVDMVAMMERGIFLAV